MKKILLCIMAIVLVLAFSTGCKKNEDAGASEKETEMLKEQASKAKGLYDIKFTYKNNIYGYDLEAEWQGVKINKENPNILGSSGLDVLFDGMEQAFEELDLDNSKDITEDEWTDYEADFPFSGLEIKKDGAVTIEEFSNFSDQLSGIEAAPDKYSINFSNEDYYCEYHSEGEDIPVSMKIVKAGEAGYSFAGTSFEEGTIFVELLSEFDVYHVQAPNMEMPPGFISPLLSMYLEKDYEDNNQGALGFSSVVNKDEFMKIFSGKSFKLHYEGKTTQGVADIYDLTITPR